MDRLLDWLSAHPGSSGADISKATEIGAGRLYPELAVLENAGKVTAQWDPPEARADGGPRRRLYWVANRDQREVGRAKRPRTP